MSDKGKGTLLAAAVGIVVGAGAAIAGAIALSDKKNQKKVQDTLTKAKEVITGQTKKLDKQSETAKNNIKKAATKAINKAEKVTKAARKEVRKI